jgi:hypothetical protein
MIFHDFYENFNLQYYNNPIQFSDAVESDGVTDSLKLTFAPIAREQPYRVVVYGGAAGTTLLSEGVDFSLDYEQGVLFFFPGHVPPVPTVPGTSNIKITAYYQKFNLAQILNYFNKSLDKLNPYFPRKETVQVTVDAINNTIPAPPTPVTDEDVISRIDMDSTFYNEWDEIREIRQDIQELKGMPFERRDNLILLDYGAASVGSQAMNFPIVNRRIDYQTAYPVVRNRYNYAMKYPFWISGIKKYPKITVNLANINDSLAQSIYLKEDAFNQALILVARFGYEGRQFYMDSINITTLRIRSSMELKGLIQSLDMQLLQGLQMYAHGKGYTVTHLHDKS